MQLWLGVYLCHMLLKTNRLYLSRTLMIAAILLIVAFQAYWINRIYREEKTGLTKQANGIFRDVVYNLQVEKFKADTIFLNQKPERNLFVYNAVNAIRRKVANLRFDSVKYRNDSSLDAHGNVTVMRNKIHQTDSGAAAGRPGKDSGKNIFFMQRPGRVSAIVPDTALMKKISGVNIVVKVGGDHKESAVKESDVITGIAGTLPFPEEAGLKKIVISGHERKPGDSPPAQSARLSKDKSFIRLISSGKALDDTIPVRKLDSAYRAELAKTGIGIPFVIRMTKDDPMHKNDTLGAEHMHTDIARVGLITPYAYQAGFENPTTYLLKRITPQILFSLFLVAFTTIAFIFLYRNLAAQRRLISIKNDFINNITHELKTPISTVNVAIEALRNFGGLASPERTKEYLDISASEIQRLGLLVDKVLKLSLFENNATALQKDSFDLHALVEEVMSSMKLQFDKAKAVTSLEISGNNFMIDADKLHITSVVYNLLDNALKYSGKEPRIDVQLIRHASYFELRVSDNGIGISPAYQKKIFDQFFRVPNGDTHNIKGYGLGLSYVSHIVKQHLGIIEVTSEPGKGSTFIVKLPFAGTDIIEPGKEHKIIKRKLS